jgi:hypothetical protein
MVTEKKSQIPTRLSSWERIYRRIFVSIKILCVCMCMYGMYMCIHVCMCVCTCVFAHVVCGVPSICCSHPPWVPALRITHALVENLFPFLYSLSPSSSSDEAHNAPDAEASDKSSGHDIKLSLQIWFHQNPTVLQWEQFKASSSTNIWTPVRKDTVVHLSFWKLISEKSSCLHRWGWTKRRRLHLQSPGSTEPLQMGTGFASGRQGVLLLDSSGCQ